MPSWRFGQLRQVLAGQSLHTGVHGLVAAADAQTHADLARHLTW
jgi:hypothetical protein